MFEMANYSLEEDEEYSQLFIMQTSKVSEGDNNQNLMEDDDFDMELLRIGYGVPSEVCDGAAVMEVGDHVSYEDISDDGFVDSMHMEKLKIRQDY